MVTRLARLTLPGGAPFLVLLFFSGLSALIYEVLWTRVLLSVFGATVYASGTVLTSFMAGLGLGGFLASRMVPRLRIHPLKIYAWLEMGIGLFALVFPLVIQAITATYVSAYHGMGTSFTLLLAIRFVLAFTALLVPATLMGATLPILARFAIARFDLVGRHLGLLYGVNTLGAAFGTLLTGFVLIEFMGIHNAAHLGVTINLLVGLGALALARRMPASPAADAAAPPAAPFDRKTRIDRRVVLAALFVSGCCALAYEVLWSRILVFILGNFVQSFSVMLAAFLAGIAIGSWWLGRRVDALARPWRTFAILQAVIGLAAILILPLFSQVLVWRDSYLESFSYAGSLETYRDPWLQFTLWKVGVTFLIMFVPTFCMGASFPLANRLYNERLEGVPRGVGELYAFNTLGGITGAFLASFVMIPAIGIRNAALAFALLNLCGAAILAGRCAEGWRPRTLAPAAAAGVLAVLFAFVSVPRTVFDPVYASTEAGKELIYVDETVSGTVTIHEAPSGFRVININGLNVAGTKFGFLCTQKLQAHFPLLMHPEPENILQIGFGTGGTCFSVSTHEEVQRIDCVEINPGVIEAAPFFTHSNQGILEDERVSVVIEDARNFVITSPRRYDVILSDSIHPRFTGNGLLYTLEYYRSCAEIMNPGGIHSTWMPTAFLGTDEFKAIVRTMREVFPHVLVWYMNNTIEGYAIVMASGEPFQVDFDHLEERMGREPLRTDLAEVRIGNVYELLDCIAVSGDRIDAYLGDAGLNTEDRPIIEFAAPRNMNRLITEYRNLQDILKHRYFDEAIMGGWAEDAALAKERRKTMIRHFKATKLVLEGHQAHLVGDYRREAALYVRALEFNPDDRDAPYLLERLKRIASGRAADL